MFSREHRGWAVAGLVMVSSFFLSCAGDTCDIPSFVEEAAGDESFIFYAGAIECESYRCVKGKGDEDGHCTQKCDMANPVCPSGMVCSFVSQGYEPPCDYANENNSNAAVYNCNSAQECLSIDPLCDPAANPACECFCFNQSYCLPAN